MLKIMDLLSLPMFQGFRLVTDESGLFNEITDAKIFEDLDADALPEIYRKGVFILLSPSILRCKPEHKEEVLVSLLERLPSAICIKDTHFDTLSPWILDRANQLHVPVFFFSDLYLDDILYKVKNSLTPHEVNSVNINRLARILNEDLTDIQAEFMAREINPLFHRNIICVFGIPKDQENIPTITASLFDQHLHNTQSHAVSPHEAYSVLKWPRGLSLIYTTNREQADLLQMAEHAIASSGLDPKVMAIGYSGGYPGLRHLKQAFLESTFAAMDALLEGRDSCSYGNVGLIGFLAPFRSDPWADTFYDRLYQKLTSYDKENGTNLFHTLTVYVEEGGNVGKTAELTFQHSNTIRYRLEKIKSVLGISKAPDAELQLYLFVRLHQLKKLLI